MRKIIVAILMLFAFWLVLSGFYIASLIALGLASAALVAYLSSRMNVIGSGDYQPKFFFKLPIYTVWLLWQIVKANLFVAYRIIHPRLPIESHYLKIKLVSDRSLIHLIQANSITLTPGTVSVDIEDGFIQVHTLSRENAAELHKGTLETKLNWLAR